MIDATIWKTKGAIRLTCAIHVSRGMMAHTLRGTYCRMCQEAWSARAAMCLSRGGRGERSRGRRGVCCSGIGRASFNRRCSARVCVGHVDMDMLMVDPPLQGYEVADNKAESFLKTRPLGELLLHEPLLLTIHKFPYAWQAKLA